MTRLSVAAEAEADLDGILDYLTENAGPQTALAYGERFSNALTRLIAFPRSGTPRPALGPDARIEIVYPYLLIYDFRESDDIVTLLRVLHGKRNVTEALIKRRG